MVGKNGTLLSANRQHSRWTNQVDNKLKINENLDWRSCRGKNSKKPTAGKIFHLGLKDTGSFTGHVISSFSVTTNVEIFIEFLSMSQYVFLNNWLLKNWWISIPIFGLRASIQLSSTMVSKSIETVWRNIDLCNFASICALNPNDWWNENRRSHFDDAEREKKTEE